MEQVPVEEGHQGGGIEISPRLRDKIPRGPERLSRQLDKYFVGNKKYPDACVIYN